MAVIKNTTAVKTSRGESGTTKMATECAYYQLTIDGKEVIEIDVINMAPKVDGATVWQSTARQLACNPSTGQRAGRSLTLMRNSHEKYQ